MSKKDNIKTFIDEIYSSPPKKNYPTNKVIYNHIDGIWSIDLADLSDYKTSINKGFRYIFVIIEKFSKYLWAIPLENKNSKTITDEFSNILSSSKRSPLKLESDRGSEWLNELPAVIKQYNNTIHSSTKMTPIPASKKSNKKLVYSNVKDDRNVQKPKFKLGQLVRTADIKRVFNKRDSTNYSYNL